MKIKYNAPTVLTFTFISALVLILNQTIFPGLTRAWFMVPGRGGFHPGSLKSWVLLFTHVMGHGDINHFLSNISIILLIGPILEANCGSRGLLIMIALTALTTGALNVLLFSTYLLGASGVLFMMILLSSFTNFKKGEIPLTFILILVLYLGKELINSFRQDSVSEFAHIAGGLCGSLFGFFRLSGRDLQSGSV
jgi:membrane associated rhomboid family serine protease